MNKPRKFRIEVRGSQVEGSRDRLLDVWGMTEHQARVDALKLLNLGEHLGKTLTPRFNHQFALAFEVYTDHTAEEVTADEVRAAIRRRLNSLDDSELMEAVGLPYETDEEE